MLKQKLLSDRNYSEDETQNEILRFTLEKLPQYKWLAKYKENKNSKKIENVSRD